MLARARLGELKTDWEAEESCFVRAESLSLDVIEAGCVRVFEKTAKVEEALVTLMPSACSDTSTVSFGEEVG